MTELVAKNDDFDPYAVDDGSRRLWNRNYILVMTANFLLFFSLYNLMPVLPIYLADECHAGKDVIGEVMSGFIITALMIRPFSGYIVDSFPRKKVLLVCYGAFVVMNIGYVVFSTVLAIAIVRVLQGFAFGSTSVSNSTVAIDVLPSCRRSEGIGYYGISNNLAMAIGPSVALALYHSVPDIQIVFSVPLADFRIAGIFVRDGREKQAARDCQGCNAAFFRPFLPDVRYPGGADFDYFRFCKCHADDVSGHLWQAGAGDIFRVGNLFSCDGCRADIVEGYDQPVGPQGLYRAQRQGRDAARYGRILDFQRAARRFLFLSFGLYHRSGVWNDVPFLPVDVHQYGA